MYVCDSENHHIQVFDQNLKFLRCFGSHGTGPGQFNWPDNIDFDTSGHLYVTDLKNHRIQCLTADGDPIRCIGRKGSGPGEFTRPNILRVVGSHIFVTDASGVSVFTSDACVLLPCVLQLVTIWMVLLLMRMVLCMCLTALEVGLLFSKQVTFSISSYTLLCCVHIAKTCYVLNTGLCNQLCTHAEAPFSQY